MTLCESVRAADPLLGTQHPASILHVISGGSQTL